MKTLHLLFLLNLFTLSSFSQGVTSKGNALIIAKGQMPNMTKDDGNNIHIVYGIGDSIMYLSSTNEGKSFSSPVLVAVLPKVFATAMRGPQITSTTSGLIITANTTYGNIYAYYKEGLGKWSNAMKVNDVDSVSKEALMSLSADGLNAFTVWLDTRGNNGKGQRLYGAQSKDGGRTWSRNILVYASPDKTICECCKPSVAIRGKKVYAMFRNWINGDRDLYLVSSSNGGKTFRQAQKLGVGSWRLDGCPMDGGGLVINHSGIPQTVWRRESKIYAATPGFETVLGEGRSCSMETVNGNNIYTWTLNGDVVVVNSQGQKKVLGKGRQPLLKALNNEHVICVWENEKQIYAQVLVL